MTREINAGDRDPILARQRWRTPAKLAVRIVERFAIDLDAMATHEDTIVPRFIGPNARGPDKLYSETLLANSHARERVAIDALSARWALHGERIFVNPPFSLLVQVVNRMCEAHRDGASVVMLAPDNGDTKWFAMLADEGAHVWRFRGRVRYTPPDETMNARSAAFPSALYILSGCRARVKGAAIPTYAVDRDTLEIL